MKRYAIAGVLLAAFGATAEAQLPPPPGPAPQPQVLPPGPPPLNVVLPPPTIPPGPAIPFIKSGNVVIGADGYYPYDTGMYLLAGTGVDRYGGYFTMMFPGGNVPAAGAAVVPYAPAGRGHFHGKHRLFRH
jgi:hypothetical protein